MDNISKCIFHKTLQESKTALSSQFGSLSEEFFIIVVVINHTYIYIKPYEPNTQIYSSMIMVMVIA